MQYFLAVVSVLLLFSHSAVAEQDAHWRQDVQDMLDEGKTSSALYMLEDVASRLNEETDSLEQINRLRYLADLYYQAGKPAIAQGYFAEGVDRALELKPLWKRFSAVISVLEMHDKTIEDHEGLAEIIQQTLDVSLLTAISRDAGAKEIGRYIQTWDEAATASQVLQLLDEIRELKFAGVRQRALLALTKITFLADNESRYLDKPSFPYDAVPMEKFLWQVVMTKILAQTAGSAEYQESLDRTIRLAKEVDEAQYSRAKRILRALQQENP